MAHVRTLLLEAYEHADYSVLNLIEKLGRPRNASRFPLFSTTFNLEPLSAPPMFALEVEWVSSPVGHSKFDFGVNVMERGDGLQLDCDFNTDIFDSETITRTLGYFRTLLEDAARHSARRLSELTLMTEAQRRQVVGLGSNGEARRRARSLSSRGVRGGRAPDGQPHGGRLRRARTLLRRVGRTLRTSRAPSPQPRSGTRGARRRVHRAFG